MAIADVSFAFSPSPGVDPLVGDLRSIRRLVADNVCRAGATNREGKPCLVGIIMENIHGEARRGAIIEAIASCTPSNHSAERAQIRVMRYCRHEGTDRKAVLRIIDAAIRRAKPAHPLLEFFGLAGKR